MWTIAIIIWFLIGIATSIALVFDCRNKKLSMSLNDIYSMIAWILIGPILWLSFGLMSLNEFLSNNSDKTIIKFKNHDKHREE